jgi:hypothetical protein
VVRPSRADVLEFGRQRASRWQDRQLKCLLAIGLNGRDLQYMIRYFTNIRLNRELQDSEIKMGEKWSALVLLLAITGPLNTSFSSHIESQLS